MSERIIYPTPKKIPIYEMLNENYWSPEDSLMKMLKIALS